MAGAGCGAYCVAGPAAAAALFFFLRRRQNHTRKPMRARPRMGPTTAPAIQALLEDFSSEGEGRTVGLEALASPSLLSLEVVSADVGRVVEVPVYAVSGRRSRVVVNTDEMMSLQLQAVHDSRTSSRY